MLIPQIKAGEIYLQTNLLSINYFLIPVLFMIIDIPQETFQLFYFAFIPYGMWEQLNLAETTVIQGSFSLLQSITLFL